MNEQQFPPPNDYQPFPPYPGPEAGAEVKQSGLGIASFVLGIVSILTFIICILIATSSIMDYITSDGKLLLEPDDLGSNISLILSLLLILGSMALSFIGLILGIVAVCMKNRRKAFGIVGIVLNGLLALGSAGLMVLSIFAPASF